MIVTKIMTDDDNHDDNVLDLSVKKVAPTSNEIILKQNQNLASLISPPLGSSTSLTFAQPSKQNLTANKRTFESTVTSKNQQTTTTTGSSNKRPLRFQCKHCDYKAPSTSLMQNHIYRHTDLTPYSCAYCGHKSTTKSTIMVHIELCHPNMEVKIHENRVREQDFYRDLNSTEITSATNSSSPSLQPPPPPPLPPLSLPSISTTANGTSSTANTQEPQNKKQRVSNQYDSESEPINGVAISLKNIVDDGNESSHGSDDTSEMENLEPIPFDDDEQPQIDVNLFEASPTMVKSSRNSKSSSQQISTMDSSAASSNVKESDSEDNSEYLLVYNRPKQYYGSLYEPDKQYACKLCSYTTNHRPSMEDHVFVHTNEKPYKCGYCGEEIYTRYAATYHIKYKHAGMPRNFIQNKADVTQYYVNRAKKDDEKNQFKVIDTRRIKISSRNGKSTNNQQNKPDSSNDNPVQEISPSNSNTSASSESTAATNNSQITSNPPDYRFLFAWSYYLAASQAAWLSPMLQQPNQLPPNLPTDPEAAAKFLQQAMQKAIQPAMTGNISNNNKTINHNGNTNNEDEEDGINENEVQLKKLINIKKETDES